MRILLSIVAIIFICPVLYSQNDSTEFHLQNTSADFFHYTLWDIILAILIAIVFICIYFLVRYSSSLGLEIKRVGKSKIANLSQLEQYSNPNIVKLQNEMKQLRDLVRDSKEQLVLEKIEYEEKAVEVEFKLPPKPAEDVFYMATPNGEKSFDISAKTEVFKATQSLYKFTINNSNRDQATFAFQSDDTGIRDSVNSPHIYIEPVCDPQNALNQNAKRIITLRPGTAEKRNDKWIVLTKAQIKYE